jgi:sulfoxide reductase heme-binding subunit YedZ
MTLWYLARAAGFAALLAATASIVLGALASARPARDARGRDRRILRQLAHRSAGVVTLSMLALHVVLLVIDRFVDLSPAGVLLPFTAGYRAFALGVGTLAAYLLLVVAVTGALRGRLARSAIAARAWRGVHASAYVVWLLATAHGFLAGSDTGRWWAWPLYAASALAVLVAGVIRLGAVDDHRADALPTARRELTSGGVR